MNQNSKTNEDSIDLKELFFSLIAQWKIIACCVILSLICALLYLRITPDTYAVDAMVQVEDSKGAASAALLGDLSKVTGGLGQKSPTDAEIEILKSRMVLGQVIHNLNLDIKIKDNQSGFTAKLITQGKSKLEYRHDAVIYSKKDYSLIVNQLNVPEYYLDKPLKLEFKDANRFNLISNDQIVFTGVLNKNNILNTNKGLWQVKINTQGNIKEQSYTLIKLSLLTAVNQFNAIYKIAEKGKMTGVIGLSYSGQDPEHITQVLNNVLNVYHEQNIERKSLESKQTLAFLEKQLPELKKQLEDSEIKFNQFREKYRTVDVNAESELLLKQNIDLEKLKIELQQKQAELSAKYTNDHPLILQIDAQIAEINKKIGDLNNRLTQLPETQRLYLQLYRDVKVNTELYTSLLNSYQQLKIANAGEIGNVRIIDTAVEPVKPIKPQKLIVLILSILAGGFIGVLIALLRNMMRSGVKDSAQIENELDLPVYATVPRSPIQETRMSILKKKKSIPILAVKNSDDIAIESLRSIRTAIHFALTSAKNNIIMIAGPSPEVGKSFISTNLATIFAQGNKRVLLIDADMRRGYMHKYFDVDVKPGLSELLSGQADLTQVLHKTQVANLDVITRGKSPTNPSEMLSSTQFKELLEQLQTQYDHIIIDTPPVLAVTDGIIISQYTGVNLIVARYIKSHMKELELTVNRFEQAGVKVNGFILNDIQRSSGGGYGYNYAYAYKAQKED
ncbi:MULTISPECIES: polysaccharide biosynthesis tyrosine autokinase [Acinetobacter calcoaceticus/baumannii complex]|uniref:polysaccharide biosynthesis tyrosine autokinase n=1 Tax=Acinetobacter calcoaceticus/baumannii complex TaxID=909768 RepID=UPI000453821B|nr:MULTISPECIES: polysaccharide biosynthesis tyrosine autokinase [Acinetobacter calcoaceticus/baumannii complex]MCZ3261723.1 polysaccharide biosynthesis tyrosine autokinase [Acinetobacter baumannii]EXB67512.1 tyrosine-protein kinase ptk [Acinetobacter sp. 21871]EXR60997.1 tyrosine-protein kinase ptk [Acinetobacter sp. 1424608]MBJ9725737.1 polysaccharide biosynthesis tyrosine autokinase [Acinetobacter nosocomialis]MBP1491315.1 polysaccharide biosynthesis tyrosine autokinase [Acinetobacter nosoc